jgi:uncharacterized membrane protein
LIKKVWSMLLVLILILLAVWILLFVSNKSLVQNQENTADPSSVTQTVTTP